MDIDADSYKYIEENKMSSLFSICKLSIPWNDPFFIHLIQIRKFRCFHSFDCHWSQNCMEKLIHRCIRK